MVNKKTYISLIVIFIIFIGIVYLINNYQKMNKKYLILSDNEIYSFENDKLKKVTKDIEKQLNITSISDSTEYLTFTYKNNYLLFYEDGEPINIPSNFHFAYSSKLNIEVQDYKYIDVSEENLEKFDEILKNHDIIGYTYLNISKKLSYDFDSDGIKEDIYFVTNLFDEDEYDKVFSFVYYIKDDQIIYLQEDVTNIENAYDLCLSDANDIFSLNNQKYMIITCRYFSNKGVENKMYQYKKGNFNLMN